MNNYCFQESFFFCCLSVTISRAHHLYNSSVMHFCYTSYRSSSVLFFDFIISTRYYRMCEAAQVGLGRNASVHSIHGSLLAVGELLR